MSSIVQLFARRWRRLSSNRPGRSSAALTRASRNAGNVVELTIGLVFLLAVLALHAFWFSAIRTLAENAPLTTELASLTVDLPPGKTVILGRNELAQRPGASSAETDHIEISTATADGKPTIRNVAKERKLFLTFAGAEGSSLARWDIEDRDTVRVRDTELAFGEASKGVLKFELRRKGTVADYEIDAGGSLTFLKSGGQPVRICEEKGFDLRDYIAGGRARTVALIGGQLDCVDAGVLHLPVPAIEWQAMAIVEQDGNFRIIPRAVSAGDLTIVQFQHQGQQPLAGFSAITRTIEVTGPNALTGFIAGKTKYRVDVRKSAGGLEMVIRPESKNHLFRLETKNPGTNLTCPGGFAGLPLPRGGMTQCLEAPSTILERGAGADILSQLGGLEQYIRIGMGIIIPAFVLFMLVQPLIRMWHRRGRETASIRRSSEMVLPIVAVSATGLLVALPELFRYGLSEPLSVTQGLQLTVAAFLITAFLGVWRQRAQIAFCIGLLTITSLICLGTLVMFSLALDGDTNHFMGFITKHKMLFLDPLVIAMMIALTVPVSVLGWFTKLFLAPGWRGFWSRMSVAVVPVILILFWAAAGDESGLKGFQPVELTKIATVILLGVLMTGLYRAIDARHAGAYKAFITLALAVLALFMMLLVGVPVVKSDYSPALITILVIAVMFFTFALYWAVGRLMEIVERRNSIDLVPAVIKYPTEVASRGWKLAVTTIAVSVLVLAVARYSLNIVNLGLTGNFSIAADVEKQLLSYKEKRLSGGIGTIADRFYAFIDGSHDPARRKPHGANPADPTAPATFVIRDRDAGLQLLLSKIAVANAPCGIERVGFEGTPALTMIAQGVAFLTDGACKEKPLGFRPLQNPISAAPALEPAAAAAPPAKPVAEETPYFVDDLIAVPVVQNDFIGAYLIARFGLGTALIAVLLQSIFVVANIYLFWAIKPPAICPANERLAREFLRMLLIGLTVLLMLHWGIAWSNVLGLLPIMGQPMSFVAAATSHHLFMVMPAILLMIMAARYTPRLTVPGARRPPRRGLGSFFLRSAHQNLSHAP